MRLRSDSESARPPRTSGWCPRSSILSSFLKKEKPAFSVINAWTKIKTEKGWYKLLSRREWGCSIAYNGLTLLLGVWISSWGVWHLGSRHFSSEGVALLLGVRLILTRSGCSYWQFVSRRSATLLGRWAVFKRGTVALRGGAFFMGRVFFNLSWNFDLLQLRERPCSGDVAVLIGECCRSVTFWFGSGSADPCLWQMDPAPDPAIFVIDLQDANKKLFFLLFTFWRYCYIIFQRQKIAKKSQYSRNQGFSYCCCLMKEGSGSGCVYAVHLTNGSGSRRHKNIRILPIRIRNTA